jgi:hypothetical protein
MQITLPGKLRKMRWSLVKNNLYEIDDSNTPEDAEYLASTHQDNLLGAWFSCSHETRDRLLHDKRYS